MCFGVVPKTIVFALSPLENQISIQQKTAAKIEEEQALNEYFSINSNHG